MTNFSIDSKDKKPMRIKRNCTLQTIRMSRIRQPPTSKANEAHVQNLCAVFNTFLPRLCAAEIAGRTLAIHLNWRPLSTQWMGSCAILLSDSMCVHLCKSWCAILSSYSRKRVAEVAAKHVRNHIHTSLMRLLKVGYHVHTIHTYVCILFNPSWGERPPPHPLKLEQ